MRFRRFIAAAAIGTASLAFGVGAYAYFTTSGSGTGAAVIGAADHVQLDGTTSSSIYPGAPGIDVAIKVTNPGKGAQHVGTVSLDSVDTPLNCVASDFTMAPVAVNQTIAAGASSTVHGTLTMADNGDQNACQGGSLTMHLSSN
jgi:hypothetical protein